MKKIHLLFYTTWDFTNENEDGIAKKIRSQILVLKDRGYIVDFTYIKEKNLYFESDKSIDFMGRVGIGRKISANFHIQKMLANKKYDRVYIRYSFADCFFIKALKNIKKNNSKIILEIPTFPYEKELKLCLSYRILLFLDKIYRNRMKKYVDKIVTYSDDIEIYGIPTIQTVNGLAFNTIEKRNVSTLLSGIHLIAVASLAEWHAYDRIIKGMGEYYNNGGKEDINFHIVGEGPPLKEYKMLVKQYDLEKKVVFHGFLSGKNLDNIYNKVNIAVSILGLYRRGCKIDTSIKVAEYGAKGLPIIAVAEITDYPLGEEYQMIISNDNKPVDMNDVIEFHKTSVNKKEVSDHIIKYIAKKRDMTYTFKKIFDYLESDDN